MILRRIIILIVIVLISGCEISHRIHDVSRPNDQPPLTDLEDEVDNRNP